MIKKFFMAVIALMMTVSVSAQFYIYLSNGDVLQADSISLVAPSAPVTPDPIIPDPTPTGDGVLSGEFSVSATTKVHFSQGNLQYVGIWQFAEHQWDYFGDNQYDNHRDLFGWGTGDAPNKVSTDYNDYSTFVDWGANAITNGGNEANQWRTLTKDEWGYLFNSRTEASSKYGAAKVNGITGVVLLPDNWTLPSGCGFTAGMTNASSWNDWSLVASTNIYDASQWSLMESAGAVFLPAAGGCYGTGVYPVRSYGFYWSATPYDTGYACYLGFGSDDLYPQRSSNRNSGLSVRLVR